MLMLKLTSPSVKQVIFHWSHTFTSAVTACLATAILCLSWPSWADDNGAVGDTRVAQWKDDRTAAFLLMFDDSYPSHWQVAAPALVKRGMIATFYINPGKAEYQKFTKEWEDKLWKQGMVYGDHTMTHRGVKDKANADWEIGEAAHIIRKIVPGKEQRLVSYGQPGVGPKDWNINKDELKTLLHKYNLIDRPTFDKHGAVYHLKTTDEMLALADNATKTGSMEYLVIHGVERILQQWGYQDFWALKQEVFLPLLDGLKERSDRGELWITDHISQHQYQTERDSAEVRVLEASNHNIKLELTTKADPEFYDYPLTLITNVPKSWKQASRTQGDKVTVLPVENGTIKFDAIPGAGVISIAADPSL
ncbi:MAG: polysaccharide deacetylase family protein [Candidatus Methylopumilus sp.]